MDIPGSGYDDVGWFDDRKVCCKTP
jgi:hypothetical protein